MCVINKQNDHFLLDFTLFALVQPRKTKRIIAMIFSRGSL